MSGMWSQAFEQGRDECRQAYGEAQGLPRIPAGRAARALLMYRELARRTGIEWNWFLPALAILGYDKKGDKFPGQDATSAAAAAAKLVPLTPNAYFWMKAQQLVDALDHKNVSLQVAMDLVPYWQNLDVGEWSAALTHVGLDAWDELKTEREHGVDPSWPDDLNAGGTAPNTPVTDDDVDVEERRTPDGLPLPDKPPPSPIPPPTVPRLPSVSGGGALILVALLLLASR